MQPQFGVPTSHQHLRSKVPPLLLTPTEVDNWSPFLPLLTSTNITDSLSGIKTVSENHLLYQHSNVFCGPLELTKPTLSACLVIICWTPTAWTGLQETQVYDSPEVTEEQANPADYWWGLSSRSKRRAGVSLWVLLSSVYKRVFVLVPTKISKWRELWKPGPGHYMAVAHVNSQLLWLPPQDQAS